MTPSDESLDGYREARPIRLTFSDRGWRRAARRITLTLLVVAEIVVLLLILAVEFRDCSTPARIREDYIRGHEVMAKDVRRLLDEASSLNPADPKLTVALERLLAWHERRAAEMRRSKTFFLGAEVDKDLLETAAPTDPAIRDWVSARLYPKNH